MLECFNSEKKRMVIFTEEYRTSSFGEGRSDGNNKTENHKSSRLLGARDLYEINYEINVE